MTPLVEYLSSEAVVENEKISLIVSRASATTDLELAMHSVPRGIMRLSLVNRSALGISFCSESVRR